MIPAIPFSKWCEHQGIEPGWSKTEGSDSWWYSQLKSSGWSGCYLGAHEVADCPATVSVCDIARVMLRLPNPDGRGADSFLPGCKKCWWHLRIWQSMDFWPSFNSWDRLHKQARDVLAHYGEQENKQPMNMKDDKITLAQRDIEAAERSLSEARRRLEEAQAPAQPTDAELRERLRVALGGEWTIHEAEDMTVEWNCGQALWGYFSYSSLRKPGGIEACARALRVLAGVEGE